MVDEVIQTNISSGNNSKLWLWITIGVVVIALIAAGILFFGGKSSTSSSGSSQNAADTQDKSLVAAYSTPCDLSKVSKLTKTSSATTADYTISGNNIFDKNNKDVTSLLKNIICISGIGGEISTYLSGGGNTEGNWFTITNGNKTANINIKEITQEGKKVLVIEDRTPTVLPINTMFPLGNYVYLRQRQIYRDTGLTHLFVSTYVPGTDAMLDKSIEEIGASGKTVSGYIPITYTYS